jgi:D-glycero-D-manno-heptose 1,7-bisphosphate phosphatase
MLQKAMARFHIDASSSFMIGDTPRDMEAAETAGVKGILVPSNSDLLETVKTLV